MSPFHVIFLRGRTGVDRHSSKNWCGASATRGALKTGRCSEIQASSPPLPPPVRAVRAVQKIIIITQPLKKQKYI